jgi:hypothetical protein
LQTARLNLCAVTGAREGAWLRPGAFLCGVMVSALLGWPGSAIAQGPSSRPDVILSNEFTHTTWALADVSGAIRSQPGATARKITRLDFFSPDGFQQSYILLRERWLGSHAWVKLRIPMRPNGRVGWVPRRDLAAYHVTHLDIVVDRAKRRLTLYRYGKAIYHAPVGVGKPSTPTPPGRFWITEAFPSSDAFYGPYAFGTSDYSTLSEWPGGGIVGLHGTNEPQLVPGDPSHGCIRLHNKDILALSRLVRIGTPLRIK